MTAAGTIIAGVYDIPLVALSVLIAILAAGAAIDLASHVTSSRGRARLAWLTGGAIAMGTGIWSMHYIGMLAFRLPIPVLYDWPTVLLSLLAAVLASWVSLFVVSRRTMNWPQVLLGSVLMGGGIAAMHYIGMEAMRLPAMHRYTSGLVTLSVVLAIAIASVALFMTFIHRRTSYWGWRKVVTASVMGAAIPIMHYVGMAAVTFMPMELDPATLNHAIGISDLGIVSITLVTLTLLGLVFVTSTIDRRFATQALALESSEERYRMIVENASDAFLEIDPQGRLTGWNTHAEKTFGWSRQEAIGMPVSGMILFDRGHAAAGDRLREWFGTQKTASGRERIEVTARHRDGHTFHAEMNLATIEISDRTSFAAFVHDVTARKQAEQEREKAKQAAEAGSRAKSEFLANMSHEIRTPMNGMIGMSELLLDTSLDSTQRDYAETIRDSSTALLTIINDILDFSKVEAGKVELESVDVDLRGVFEDVARLLSIQAHSKGVELTAQIDAQLPTMVKGDPGRFRQVLLNLGGNAVKFTAAGEVSLKIEVEQQTARGVKVRCEVRDTGIGIPPGRLASLYAPFTQADTSTTRKFGGTGLGLSIVKRLVDLMGGETGVESAAGRGSTFWFTAWMAPSTHARQPTPPFFAPIRGKRILAVDDNATNRKVLLGQLLLCGTHATAASSAEEALTLLRQAHREGKPFDAALLDHQMPDLDGEALGRIIVADDALKTTRLILLTSSGQRDDGTRYADIGFAGYLLKPVTQRELNECLTLALAAPAEAWHMKSQPIITQQALQSVRAKHRAQILLAEDNIVNQKVAVRLLEKLGYRVDVAQDGRAAVNAWLMGSYDLLLMDCQMPELDGYEATREIRRLEDSKPQPTRRTPIIALTADALKGTEAACKAAGMDGYLSKPIDRVLLESTLAGYLSTAD